MAEINLGNIKFNWKGAYAGGTAYVVDDVVESGGSSYVCILASTGNTPPNGTYWNLMAEAGTDGTDVLTTLTTTGDMLYRDGSGAQRLGIGTAAQELRVNSGASAPEWYTPAAGGQFRTLISTSAITTSTASLSITGMDSTYSRYFITMTDINSTNDNVTLYLQLIVGGSIQTGTDYPYGNTGRNSSLGLTGNESSDSTFWKMNQQTQGFAAGEAFMGEITLYNPSGTVGYKTATWTTILQGETGQTNVHSGGGTYMNGTAATTGVRFYYSVGNIASGVWKLWGSNE